MAFQTVGVYDLTVLEPYGEGRKDINVRTAQLVHHLVEVGPSIPEIARRLGQFKESVRYRYKEKILNAGFAVQAMPDHEKLGLKRVEIIADFASDFRPYVAAIASAMNELCYVVYYCKVIPEGLFIIGASVPSEFVDAYSDFFNKLKDRGLFSSVEVHSFDYFRNIPMRAEYYDFNSGRWDFDWSPSSRINADAAKYRPAQKERFDFTDLLILKELQIDANKSLTEIAGKLKINYKKLAWHYQTHVIGREMIKGYRVNWMGTRYNYKLEKALHRKHRYFILAILAKDLTELERVTLASKLIKLPFLWSEASGSDYFVEAAFPVDVVTEALQYIGESIAPMRDRVRYFVEDQTNAMSFTFSYQLYDESSDTWQFNPKQLVSRFDDLIIKIKRGTG